MCKMYLFKETLALAILLLFVFTEDLSQTYMKAEIINLNNPEEEAYWIFKSVTITPVKTSDNS